MTNVLYNATCWSCGRVWMPGARTPLWWKAHKHAQEGYIDAVCVSPKECGCVEEQLHPDAPYRVIGYSDMGDKLDIPYLSLVPAAKKYLELEREGCGVVIFVDTRWHGRGLSSLTERLKQLARGW